MENKIVDIKEFSQIAKLNNPGGELIAKFLMQLLKFNKINKVYSQHSYKKGIDFIESALEALEIKFEYNEQELKRIPANGAFITTSNHPLAGIDALLLLKILLNKRPDFKLITNPLLQKIDPLNTHLFNEDIFKERLFTKQNECFQKLQNHLNAGNPLGVFPAGTLLKTNYELRSDLAWKTTIIEFIKQTNAPIIPIYIKARHSRLLGIFSKIHPLLRDAKLPSEVLKQKKKPIIIRIGNAISPKEQNEFENIDQFGRFLRAKTYALGTTLNVKKFYTIPKLTPKKKPELIIDAQPIEKITAEIERIKEEYLLFQSNKFEVFCAPSSKIPTLLQEIGRLREITFRKVGEGTNQSIDIDEFDLYYHHLIIWDPQENQIVGSYRLGKGREIIAQYGKKGFYTHSLFKIKKQFIPILENTIELGRSFITPDYQRKPLSLFLLWKGILYFLLKNTEYRYLFGPVSISNDFSKFSKSLLVDFMQSNIYNEELAKLIIPRKKFRISKQYSVIKNDIQQTHQNIEKVDKFIQEIETNLRAPVLIKKYMKLNAKLIGFNIDPKFNNCLDGLMILDLFDIPLGTIKSLSKELNDDSILKRFNLADF